MQAPHADTLRQPKDDNSSDLAYSGKPSGQLCYRWLQTCISYQKIETTLTWLTACSLLPVKGFNKIVLDLQPFYTQPPIFRN